MCWAIGHGWFIFFLIKLAVIWAFLPLKYCLIYYPLNNYVLKGKQGVLKKITIGIFVLVYFSLIVIYSIVVLNNLRYIT